jgi:UDP-glucose:(glucosyl)LPS alpha-1,2-glucosyltransferase
MSSALPPVIAVVLPPREGFGPRRARGIGLTVRHHSLSTSAHRTVVFGGRQAGPVFLDVTFRLVRPPFFIPGTIRTRYAIELRTALRLLKPALIEVHADPAIALRL